MTAVLVEGFPAPAPGTAAFALPPPVAVRRRRRWPLAAGLVAFVVYAVVGVWLMAHGNFAIGDALVRSANARVILFSRDPHLAALGMAWMPLPVLSQLPFVALLHPLGLAWWSGPVSTAAYGGATVYVLGRMSERLRVRPAVGAVVVGLYGLSPIVVFWAGSGMSEACTFFFLTAAASLFLAWTETPEPWLLGGVGIMLGLATLSRYEMLAFALAIAVGAGLMSSPGRRIRMAVVVVIPSIFVMLVWLTANKILLRDAFAWWHNLNATARPPAGASWLPARRTVITSVQFVGNRLVRLAPVLLVAGPLAALAERRRAIAAMAVLAGFSSTPLATGYFLLKDTSWGNLRYFLPFTVAGTVLTLWVLRGDRLRGKGRMLLCALLAVGTLVGSLTETDHAFAGVESEFVAMRDILHLQPAASANGADNAATSGRVLSTWRTAATEIDRRTSAHDLIVADTSGVFPIILFTKHLDRFLISEDRQFEQQLQLTRPLFNMVLLGGGGPAEATLRTIVSTPPPSGAWEKVYEQGSLQLWRLNPDTPASRPAAVVPTP